MFEHVRGVVPQAEDAVEHRALVELARKGDTVAFTELLDAALSRLDGAARLIVRDPDLAHDADIA